MASSFTQGRIAYEHVLAFLRAAGHDLEDRQRWRLQDSANSATIEDRQSGARGPGNWQRSHPRDGISTPYYAFVMNPVLGLKPPATG